MADWVALTSDTLAEDGILEFYAATNDGDNGRRAEIRVSYADSPEQFVGDFHIPVRVAGCGG